MTKKQIKKTQKDLYTSRMAGLVYHTHRIKEQRKVIKDAKNAIKMHKLLQKQVKTEYKLALLEK